MSAHEQLYEVGNAAVVLVSGKLERLLDGRVYPQIQRGCLFSGH